MKFNFRFYGNSIIDHLNFFGMILFTTIISLFCLINPFPIKNELISFIIIANIFTIATSNLNKIDFPYRYRTPGLFYTSNHYGFKHLFYGVFYGYLIQLSFSVIFGLIAINTLDFNLLLLLPYFEVAIYFISIILTSVTKVLIRALIYVVFASLILTESKLVIFYILLLQATLILIDIFCRKYISQNFNLLKVSKIKIPRMNLILLIKTYITENILFTTLIAILLFSIGWIIQHFLIYNEVLPILSYFQIIYISILELLIGSDSDDIFFNSSRTKLLYSSRLNRKRRFLISEIFAISLIFFLICFIILLGSTLSNLNIFQLLKNILLLPFPFFIGWVYFIKSEYLVIGTPLGILKFSLPIIYLIIITFNTLLII